MPSYKISEIPVTAVSIVPNDLLEMETAAGGTSKQVSLGVMLASGIVPTGTLANRPAANAGYRFYLAVDGSLLSSFFSDGTTWFLMGRQLLAGPITIYVDGTLGSNSNSGLSPSLPVRTIQRGVNIASSLDTLAQAITVSVAAGTYNEQVLLPAITGGGSVTVVGDATTPTNVVVDCSGFTYCFGLSSSRSWTLRGMKLQGATGFYGVYAQDQAAVALSAIEFGTFPTLNGVQAFATRNSEILFLDNYAISGGCFAHLLSRQGSLIVVPSGAVTIKGAVAISSGGGFYWADEGGIITCNVAFRYPVTTRARASSIATLTTMATHNFIASIILTVAGMSDATFNKVNLTTATGTTGNLVKYSNTGSTVATTAESSGYIDALHTGRGTLTGRKFLVQSQGLINVYGAGISHPPGTIAGVVTAPGAFT